MKKQLSLVLLCTTLTACETLGRLNEPQTLGELNSGYNYIPVDPLEISVALEDGPVPTPPLGKVMQAHRYLRCIPRADRDDPAGGGGAAAPAATPAAARHSADVMDALPDHTIRMAVRTLSGKGSGGFGPVALSASGTSYQVVMDSIFADVTNVRFAISVDDGSTKLHSLRGEIPPNTKIEVVRLRGPGEDESMPMKASDVGSGFEEVAIPVYIGAGLRLTASLFTKKGGINLSNLPALAASADAEQSSGSLTMQTLGIYGQQVASTFGIPSELSGASVQSALVSMGSVKAITYDRDTGVRPRLTGIYNPLGTSDPLLINKIYSALASRAITWSPCSRS